MGFASKMIMQKKQFSLADVAKLANVSVGTASMALSQNPVVSKKTREHVHNVAMRLGYKKDIMGKCLANNRSFLLGLLGRETYVAFTMEVMRGIQDICLEKEYSLVTYLHGDSVADEKKHLEISRYRKVDGLIITPALDVDGKNNGEAFRSLLKDGIPVVQIFGQVIDGIPAVMVDYEKMSFDSTKYLIDRGHRRIAHLTLDKYNDATIPNFYHQMKSQWHGYERAMLLAGLEPLVLTHSCHFYFEGGLSIGKTIMTLPYKPTAVVASSDSQAIGLMKGLYDMGYKVPDDMSIIAYHNLPKIIVGLPVLTTYTDQLFEIGKNAAQICFDIMAGEDPKNILLEPVLQEGASVRSI